MHREYRKIISKGKKVSWMHVRKTFSEIVKIDILLVSQQQVQVNHVCMFWGSLAQPKQNYYVTNTCTVVGDNWFCVPYLRR